MDRPLLFGGVLTGVLALLAWTQIARTAIVPCGLAAGIVVGLAGRPTDAGLIRGAKSGALGAGLFVGTVALVGAYRYRVVGTGFAIDWALFTWFAMIVLILPLFAIEGAAAAPAAAWTRRSVRNAMRDSTLE